VQNKCSRHARRYGASSDALFSVHRVRAGNSVVAIEDKVTNYLNDAPVFAGSATR